MKKILLIDDVRVPEWLTNPNTGEKYTAEEVEIARTGEEGVALLQTNQYDTLLLDHDMGMGMTGMGVIRYLEMAQEHMPPNIYLVTANIVMGPLMMEYLQRWFKEGRILQYRWINNI